MKRRIKRFLLSPKTAVSLIVLNLLASIAALTLPQSAETDPAYFEEWNRESPYTYWLIKALQLDHVFSSLWFISLASLLTIVLAYSVYNQLSALLRGRKREIRRWGGFLFHLGLLVVVLASFYTASFEKRGLLNIIESENYLGDEEPLLVRVYGLFAGKFDPGFRIRLDRFHHSYYETGKLKDLRSDVTLGEGEDEVKATVGINATVNYKGVKLYQSYYRGYALSFLVSNKDEEYYVHYKLDTPGRWTEPYEGESDIPKTEYTVKLSFRPDINKSSFYLNDPMLKLTIERWDKKHFQGVIFPEGEVILPTGEHFKWVGIRNWSGLRLVKSSSTPVALAGFWLMMAGVVMLYMTPEKRVK